MAHKSLYIVYFIYVMYIMQFELLLTKKEGLLVDYETLFK